MEGRRTTTVISLHGIRTRGAWQESLSRVLTKEGFVYDPWKFGFFWALSMISPWARARKVIWFRERYEALRRETDGPISIIAHSFGTYIVSRAMREYQNIRFDKVIFCGSIVKTQFGWSTLLGDERSQAKLVLNQYGKKDIWVRLAEWVVHDAGPSGFSGFVDLASGRVVQQEFCTYTHSQYFFAGNYEENWLPFLKSGVVPRVPGAETGGFNWKYLSVILFLLALISTGFGLAFKIANPGGAPWAINDPILAGENQSALREASRDPLNTQQGEGPPEEAFDVEKFRDQLGLISGDGREQPASQEQQSSVPKYMTISSDADCILNDASANVTSIGANQSHTMEYAQQSSSLTCRSVQDPEVFQTISVGPDSPPSVVFALLSQVEARASNKLFLEQISGSWRHTSRTVKAETAATPGECRSQTTRVNLIHIDSGVGRWTEGKLTESVQRQAVVVSAPSIFGAEFDQGTCNLFVNGDRQVQKVEANAEIQLRIDSVMDEEGDYEVERYMTFCEKSGEECDGNLFGDIGPVYLRVIVPARKITLDNVLYNRY